MKVSDSTRGIWKVTFQFHILFLLFRVSHFLKTVPIVTLLQLDLKINADEADISSYVLNGEWSLLGNDD